MTEALQAKPRAPVGSLILIALMYLPLLRYFTAPRTIPTEDGGMEFPGGIIFAFISLGYLAVAVVLPFRLYRHREASVAHRIAFFASLGILALYATFIWTVS